MIGVARDNRLQPIYDEATDRRITVPEGGIVLGSYLARKLGVGVSDRVRVEVLEGRRPQVSVPVVGTVETYIAMPAFINIGQRTDFTEGQEVMAFTTAGFLGSEYGPFNIALPEQAPDTIASVIAIEHRD